MSRDSFKEKLDAVLRKYHLTQYGNKRMAIVRDNMNLLRDANLLEEVFIHAWSYGTNDFQGKLLLLAAMDPGKLLQALSDGKRTQSIPKCSTNRPPSFDCVGAPFESR
jgi:hypothetical protein